MRCVCCLHNEPMLPYHRCSLKLLNNVGNSDWFHFMIKCSNFAGGTSLDLSSFSSQRIWNGFFESKLHIMFKSVTLMQWMIWIIYQLYSRVMGLKYCSPPHCPCVPHILNMTNLALFGVLNSKRCRGGLIWFLLSSKSVPHSPTLHLLLTRPLACHKTRPWKQWSPSWSSSRP